MESRDLEQIDQFLGMVNKTSLLEYYELAADASGDDAEQAIKRRRGWAQGQQANPKFREEALWLIRNQALLRKVLVDERDDYVAEVNSRKVTREIDRLAPLAKGTMVTGVLTADAERFIHQEAADLGVPEDRVNELIEKLLAETGARRDVAAPAAPTPSSAAFEDYYKLLNVPHTATREEIEASHRAQYRQARSLKSLEDASARFAKLDEAWRHLSDPARRKAYDALHQQHVSGAGAGEVADFFLPPPPGALPSPTAKTEPGPPQRAPASPPITPVAPPTNRPSFGGSSGVAQSPMVTPPPVAPPRPPDLGGNRAPPPPQGVVSVPSSIPASRKRQPRLTVVSADVITLEVGRKPVTHSFVVKNAGQGRMPGRVTSDRDWLVVTRTRLDPDAAQQDVQVTIDPSKMPRGKATGVVTVVTDLGDRRSINMEVTRKAIATPVLIGVAVLVLVMLALIAFVVGAMQGGDEPAPASGAQSSLNIEVDPDAEKILVNGVLVAETGRARVLKGFTPGEPVKVSASHAGFKTVEQTVVVPAGADHTVNLRLELAELLTGLPDKGARLQALDAGATAQAISTRIAQLQDCLRQNLTSRPGLTATVSFDVYTTPPGALHAVAFNKNNFDDEAAPLDCLRRQLRVVRFPAVEGADFGVHKGTQIEQLVTSGKG
ncbi:DnaJ domain-containing protein [Myxococcota bacterium]|nr:DnaJ domain-containing protein [Myxococcota bacterium]